MANLKFSSDPSGQFFIEHGDKIITVEIDTDNDLEIGVCDDDGNSHTIWIPFASLPALKKWMAENLPDDQS